VLFTGLPNDLKAEPKIIINQPGEYEVSGMSVQGIAARAHMDEAGQQTATIFKIMNDDVRVAILGHVYPELNDNQLEALGTIDVLIVPVGGNGYTLDGIGALALIKKIEPKIVIPTHYEDKSVNYEVPQQPLEEALKGLAMEPGEPLPKLKLKSGEFPETTQLVILERQ
ncbi:MAG TPA: MBL fold metallo-hydrolase, partial [Candidatus Limnocylindrales bacterium]|nr:MBL fold metallo-hydrolase [Candidatus Limnocylindrales bacterium]